jgi:hypothetical protein
MVEASEKFQGIITRKAAKFFFQKEYVSFDEFHHFVNQKMGTEFHEEFTKLVYP